MATKMWFSRTSFSICNPGTIFTWGSSVKSIFSLHDTDTDDSSYLTSTYTGYGLGTVLFRQFISKPMDAGIVFNSSTTYTCCMRHSESSTAANAFQLFGVAIISEDGTTIRDQFDALEKDGTEFATSLTARSNLRNGTSGISYTTVSGDRLVVEVGWDQDASGSYSISNSLGNTGSFLSGDGDTSILAPFIEFSNTITFHAEGGGAPATNEDFDATVYISGVHDDWA